MTARTILSGGAGLLLLGYLATGWVEIAPGEVVVVRRLGRVLPRPWPPGPHLGWPAGFDQRTRVRTDEVRRLEVGLAGTAGPEDEPGAGEFLTGDLNLIRARAVLHYRISDPLRFVIRGPEVEPLLARMAESGLARALARRGIDAALLEGRRAVGLDVEAELSRAIDLYGMGLAVLGVSVTDARPPAEVSADFAAAQSARSESDRRVIEAKSYEAATLPGARSQALAKVEQARARADRAVLLARSRASRFVALLEELGSARGLTVRRIYLDALRDLLPRVKRKLVMTPEEPVDLSILGGDPR